MSEITETQLKLRDAGTQMKLAIDNNGNEDIFRSCINAYISAARSVTMVMEKESAIHPRLLAWYKGQTTELGKLPLMKFFNDRRVHTIHRGNVKPISHTMPIWNMAVNGKKLEPGTGTMTVWVFDGFNEYMPGKSGNVFNLCEQYFLILKNLVHQWLYQKAVIEKELEGKMNSESALGENGVIKQIIALDENEIMEAIIRYMLSKYGNGRVSEVKWMITPEEGHKLPPIKGISARCTVEERT
jgi:hypothetical protein